MKNMMKTIVACFLLVSLAASLPAQGERHQHRGNRDRIAQDRRQIAIDQEKIREDNRQVLRVRQVVREAQRRLDRARSRGGDARQRALDNLRDAQHNLEKYESIREADKGILHNDNDRLRRDLEHGG